MSDRPSCSRCILDTSVPGIKFDEKGECNHCKLYDKLDRRYDLADADARLARLVETIKKGGEGRKYDCVVGLSGGTDSTFCLYKAKQLGLRPLAVHFDNGWLTDIARENVKKAVDLLSVDLRTTVGDWSVLKDAYRASFRASVPEMCMPCEVGIACSLYDAAAEENVHYIILGHSFRTEGMNPPRMHYVDGVYFEDVVRKHGTLTDGLRRYNKMKLLNMLENSLVRRIKTVQLPLYMDYRDAEVRATLTKELGWSYGGRHHFDCMAKPALDYITRTKFKVDHRMISLSGLVRSGQITRGAAQAALHEEITSDHGPSLRHYLSRLEISEDEFQRIMRMPPKSFLDYSSYYSFLKRFKPFVKAASKANLIPDTLYDYLFELV